MIITHNYRAIRVGVLEISIVKVLLSETIIRVLIEPRVFQTVWGCT